MSDLSSSEFGTLLESVAAKSPAPGGGAVASIAGALGAALGSMVVAYSVDRKSLAVYADTLASAGQELGDARTKLLRLGDEDAAAYSALNAAWKIDKSDPTRDKQIADAAALAIVPPMGVITTCTNLLGLLESLCGKSNRNLRSDLAIAAVLAEAAARSSRWNVLVNMPMLGSDEARSVVQAELDRALVDAGERAAAIEQACLK